MNQVDVVLLVLLVPFAVRGYWRGFVREGFALAGLLGGAVAAATWYADLARIFVEREMLSPFLAGVSAVAIVFLSSYVAAQLAGAIAHRMARAVMLGGLNRVAGVGLGVAKGATLLGIVLVLIMHLVPSAEIRQVISDSTLGRPLAHLAARVVEVGRASFTPPHPRRQAT